MHNLRDTERVNRELVLLVSIITGTVTNDRNLSLSIIKLMVRKEETNY